MIGFILNNKDISTELPPGTTVLDFVRYHQNLKGTKIGCREGDCGACTILVGELIDGQVRYRSMTSCLMPLANAAGKHIVTIEGINPEDGSLTPVQQAIVDESGTQCGFCTVGFVMSLTGFCLDENAKTPEMAVSSIDGNICRCTGYKSIERAAGRICSATGTQASRLTGSEPPAVAGGSTEAINDATYRGGNATVRERVSTPPGDRSQASGTLAGQSGGSLRQAIDKLIVPAYFGDVAVRLQSLTDNGKPPNGGTQNARAFVGGGTDLYVQKPEAMSETSGAHLFFDEELRGIRDTGDFIEIGASATVTDLLVSPVIQSIFPNLYKHLKLVSSTPIRNMATLAGNFVNASPIGDMTVWFLALDAELQLRSAASSGGNATVRERASTRTTKLRDFYLSYKQLAKSDDEYISAIRFKKPATAFRFNFEKVCKRTYLDIATVNTAISLNVSASPALAGGAVIPQAVGHIIKDAHVAAGGVAPVPLYLKRTSEFLEGKEVNSETIEQANEIMQAEISPISDVRGTADYKRLLLRQLFRAHYTEIFGTRH